MKKIRQKLHSEQGTSLLMALFLVFLATMVSIVVVNASLTSAKTVKNSKDAQQAYLSVRSVAELMADSVARYGYSDTQTTYTLNTELPTSSGSTPDTSKIETEVGQEKINGKGTKKKIKKITTTVTTTTTTYKYTDLDGTPIDSWERSGTESSSGMPDGVYFADILTDVLDGFTEDGTKTKNFQVRIENQEPVAVKLVVTREDISDPPSEEEEEPPEKYRFTISAYFERLVEGETRGDYRMSFEGATLIKTESGDGESSSTTENHQVYQIETTNTSKTTTTSYMYKDGWNWKEHTDCPNHPYSTSGPINNSVESTPVLKNVSYTKTQTGAGSVEPENAPQLKNGWGDYTG